MKKELLDLIVKLIARRNWNIYCSEVFEISGGRVQVSVRTDRETADQIAGFFHDLTNIVLISNASYKRNHCNQVATVFRSSIAIDKAMEEIKTLLGE